jgi:hypothetical protein
MRLLRRIATTIGLIALAVAGTATASANAATGSVPLAKLTRPPVIRWLAVCLPCLDRSGGEAEPTPRDGKRWW